MAAVADLLAATLNANLTAWRSAPAPVEIEHLAIEWIKEALGCDPGAGGLFTSGGSLANFTALAAARHRHCPGVNDSRHAGARAAARRLHLDARGTMRPTRPRRSSASGGSSSGGSRSTRRSAWMSAELERRIVADRAAGLDPFCVVASAGTVVTGAIDPLESIAGIARRHGLWLHVDACYGGFAALAPSVRERFAGLALADSIALDPHKWLYLPADCGCLIYRDPAALGSAFALGADYTRIAATDPEESFAFWDYGPELTRPFRALKVWMTLAHVGARAIGEAIESNLDCARYLAELVDGERRLRDAGAGRALDLLLPSSRSAAGRAAPRRKLTPKVGNRRASPRRLERAPPRGAAARRQLLPVECLDRRPLRPARLRPQLPHDPPRHGDPARRPAAGGGRSRRRGE